MEAYKNEVDLIKADLKAEVSMRDDQIEAFKKTLQGMQQVLAMVVMLDIWGSSALY